MVFHVDIFSGKRTSWDWCYSLYVLGPAHLDEITDRGKNGLYVGIYYAAAAVGPALGFIIGLPILNTWVDLKQPENSNLSTDDRNWVGAWWIGYLVGAVILLLPALPMLGFPKHFPNAEKVRQKKNELEDTIKEVKIIFICFIYSKLCVTS